MAREIVKAQQNISTLIKRWAKKTTAILVSSIVLFFSFFYITPDHKLVHGHKYLSFGVQYTSADGGDGGDGGDDDSGDGGDGDGGDDSGDGGDDDGGDGSDDGGDSGDGGDGSTDDFGGDDGGSDPVVSPPSVVVSVPTISGASSSDSTPPSSVGDDSSSGDGDSGDSGGDGGGSIVSPAGGSGGTGGPGGLDSPSVSLNRGIPEQPLAFVTLSQIPYTGFTAGWFLTGMYWLVLFIWSAVLAYFMVARKFGVQFIRASREVTTSLIPRAPLQPAVVERHAPEEASSVANDELDLSNADGADTLVLQTDDKGRTPHLELKRITATKSQSSSIIHTGENNNLSTETPQTISKYIKAIGSGKTDEIIHTIHTSTKEGKSISNVLVGALCELDRMYCRRLGEDEQLSDESIEDVFESWNNDDIQKLIHVLSAGIDHKHISPETSAKMALLRALEIAQQKKQHTPVAASQPSPLFDALN